MKAPNSVLYAPMMLALLMGGSFQGWLTSVASSWWESGHDEGGGRLVVAHARADQHEPIAGMDLLLGKGIVQGHGNAGRAGIAPLFHDAVGFLHGQSEAVHDQFDGGLPDLGEDDEVDVGDRESAGRGQLARQPGPALVVDLGRIAVEHLHLCLLYT